MRKLLLIAICICITCQAWAGNIIFIPSSGTPPPDCPSGTYAFYWDGEHSSGTGYACLASGASTLNKTTDEGSPLITTDGGDVVIVIDADNEAIVWLVSSADIDHDNASGVTICAEFKTSVSAAAGSIVEFEGDSNNYAAMGLYTTTDRPYFAYKGNATYDSNVHGSSITTDGSTYNNVCISWKAGEAGTDTAVSLDGGSSWHEEDDDIVNWISAEDKIRVGGNIVSNGSTFTLRRLVVVQSFEASDIW